ncbi:hypothetical protein [Mariniblastus fucicola]|uniref:Uncharacterized protein n=1 Tax=Mariniblastus fucicola TaxID=980251 RepID=A0A5B9P9P1_9BACT|nr:hypothetical protein [Mariniblastus fucicola]QEG21955.1 hypothetical protein MFFC18_18160 [Mariniblastus fucicola]
MIRFRISTLLWVTAIACTVLFFASREATRNRKIQELTEQIELQGRDKISSPSYADIDFNVPESADGSIVISGSRIIP